LARHNDTGNYGEKQALSYLISASYNILDTNWRFGHKEIDIICEKDDELVFIEVKTRRNSKYEKPYAAVNDKKQKMLIEAADAYIAINNIDKKVRFDVISITITKSQTDIEHFKSAFRPEF